MARARHRSVAYDLEASVAVARAVAAAGGDATPAELAGVLGYRGTNNGAFRNRLASARCFGLIAGRGDRVLLSERGQAIVSGSGPQAARARSEAFYAVPLFAAVARSRVARDERDPAALAPLLVQRFGVPRTKARANASKLLDSARQAGVLGDARRARFAVVAPPPGVRELPSNLFLPVVRSSRPPVTVDDGTGAGRRGRPMVADRDRSDRHPGADDGIWLDEGERGIPKPRRRVGVVAAAVACLTLVGVPAGLVLSSGGANVASPPPHGHLHKAPGHHLGTGPAEQRVVAALSATTDAGSFDFSYDLSQTGPTLANCVQKTSTGTSTTPTSSGPCPGRATTGPSGHRDVVSGHGTLDTDPVGMVATTSIGPSVRVDGTSYWEGAGGTGLRPTTAPPAPSTATGPTGATTVSPGSPLDNFASLVEGTLGRRAGGVAMLAMASPTGFLDLSQTEVTGADQVGTSTVDGTQLTEYDVSLDLTQLASTSGSTPEEAKTITAALAELGQQGVQSETAKLLVDPSGFIHQATAVTTFSDGGTVTLQTTLSDFGCAGTVLMPGQQGTPTPPAGCSGPDTGVPTTTAPSVTVAPSVAAGTSTGGTSTNSAASSTTTTSPAPTTTSTPSGG